MKDETFKALAQQQIAAMGGEKGLAGIGERMADNYKVLEAEDYSLPNTIEKKTPIGCKLVIEKWEDTEGKLFASLNLVYQSTDQLRNLTLLDLENPPMVFPIHLKGLSANDDGLYPFAELVQRFAETVSHSWSNPDTHSLAVREAIERQMATYPESTLQDVYKSFHQDRFGPGHMITDTASARSYLMRELSEMTDGSTVYYEPTGSEGCFVRVYLSAVADSLITADQLLDAFIQSANEVQEPQTDWATEWEDIVGVIRKYDLKVNDFEALQPVLSEAAQNHQAVHHSQAYREAYHPHYRIVERKILQKILTKE